MSDITTLAQLTQLIEARIHQLENDPDSLLRDIDVKRFPFVRIPGFDGKPQPHGGWGEKLGSSKPKVFRLIAELGPSLCGAYGDLQGAPRSAVTPSRIAKIKSKFTLRIPGELELRIPARKMLRKQAMNLNAFQLERERDPSYPKAGDKPGNVEVKALVRRMPGNMAEVTLNSPTMWKRSGRDGLSDEPLFDDEDEEAATVDGPETLESWPDPDSMFTKVANKAEFVLKTDMDMYNSTGERVHPRDFECVFAPGVWVQVDACLHLWDFSAEKADGDTSRSTKRSRTYTLVIEQMQALHEPLADVVTDREAVIKRGRSSSPALELSPPRKRPFLGLEPSSCASTTASESTIIDWAPSPPAVNEEEKGVAGGEEDGLKKVSDGGAPVEAVKKAKATKGKGKGKERAVVSEAMEQD